MALPSGEVVVVVVGGLVEARVGGGNAGDGVEGCEERGGEGEVFGPR